MAIRIRKDVQKQIRDWTAEDERLAGMPDPLRQQTGPSDEVVALWEQDFWRALARDPEYTGPIYLEHIDRGLYTPIEYTPNGVWPATTTSVAASSLTDSESILGRAPRAFKKRYKKRRS